MIQANCKFHGIGQGLFYSGVIHKDSFKEDFNFLYDCGTLYKKDIGYLNNSISNCFDKKGKKKGKIDALFISHFHKDHICGIPKLFEEYEIENVFIPYFTPEELLLLCIQNDISASSELFELYKNPNEYFSGKGVKNIYPVTSGTNYNFEKAPINYDDTNDEVNNYRIEGSVNLDFKDNSNEPNVHSYEQISIKLFHSLWVFKIFQGQSENIQKDIRIKIRELYKNIYNREFDNNIKLAIQDNRFITKAKELYNSIEGKINQSSLVLYHGPMPTDKKSYELCYKRKNNPCCINCIEHNYIKYIEHHCKWYPECQCSSGTLLTGDISLNCLDSMQLEFENFIFSVPNEIGFFQIPHHGSEYNMNIELMRKIMPNRLEISCSYGRRNRYRHPDPYMLDKLMMEKCWNIHHVVQENDFEYKIKVK